MSRTSVTHALLRRTVAGLRDYLSPGANKALVAEPAVNPYVHVIENVEVGRQSAIEGKVVVIDSNSSPGPTGTPAVWIREAGTTRTSHRFVVMDSTGEVEVNPRDAEVLSHYDWIIPGDLVRVIGVASEIPASKSDGMYRVSANRRLTFDSCQTPIRIVDVQSIPRQRGLSVRPSDLRSWDDEAQERRGFRMTLVSIVAMALVWIVAVLVSELLFPTP